MAEATTRAETTTQILDFEKPIVELQNKLEELKKHPEAHSLDISVEEEVGEMPVRIRLIDRIIPGIGIAVGPDGFGEPADGAALDGCARVDRVVVVRVDEDPDDRVVPAGVQVEQTGVGVVALEGGCRACRNRRTSPW